MNKVTGIIVALVLVLAVTGIVVKSLLFPPSDKPTRVTRKAGYMDVITVEAEMTDIVGAKPTGSEDAGAHYAKAMEIYHDSKDIMLGAVNDIRQGNARAHAKVLKALEDIRGHVAAGTQQAESKFLDKHAAGKMEASTKPENIKALRLSVTVLDTLANYYLKKDRIDDARAIYKEMFIAGWHMREERSHPSLVIAGAGIQKVALKGMFKCLPKTDDKEEAKKQRDPLVAHTKAISEFQDLYFEKLEIFLKDRFDAGDIWNVAENDEDRAWRVLAILAMGSIKFTHTTKGNASRNNALIEKFLKSTDPVEKAAAEAAKAYSQTDFNTSGVKWQ